MKPYNYFTRQDIINKKKYDALREFFYEKKKAEDVAQKYEYTLSSFYSLTRDFKEYLSTNPEEDYFFKKVKYGRNPIAHTDELTDMIIGLRKHNYSAEEIVGIINSKGYNISYGYVYKLLNKEGFARLPRRGKDYKRNLSLPKIKAPVSKQINIKNEKFYSNSTGILVFLLYIKKYSIDKIISSSSYPSTKVINKLGCILISE